MSSLAKSLNLVPVTKPQSRNIVVDRRQRLATAIDKQIAMLNIVIDGNDPADAIPGRRTPVWYWMDDTGSYFLAINYGKKPLEIGKGKYSIQCQTLDDVLNALNVVREYVVKGELDAQMTSLAKAIRTNFGR